MRAPTIPSFDIALLGHVEMLINRFDESLDFFTRVYGLKLSGLQIPRLDRRRSELRSSRPV